MDSRAKAMEDLDLIRKMMERGGKFTAISGRGIAISGVIGLAGAAATGLLLRSVVLAGPTLGASDTDILPLVSRLAAIWAVVLLAALAVNFFYIHQKARRMGYSMGSGIARRLYYAAGPALCAGGVLTLYLMQRRQLDAIPGAWLLCYGLAVIAGSGVSIAALRIMGGFVLVLGAATLLFAPQWGLIALGLGFGVAHVVFGLAIGRGGRAPEASGAEADQS